VVVKGRVALNAALLLCGTMVLYAKEDPDPPNKGLHLGWRRDELPGLMHTVIVMASL